MSYSIGSQKVALSAPQYNIFPSNADRQLVYSLDPSTPAFISLVPNAICANNRNCFEQQR